MGYFIGFMFWYFVVAAFITVLSIAVLPMPRQQTKTLGQEMLSLVILIGICIWSGLLNFGLLK